MQDKHRHELVLTNTITSDGTLTTISQYNKQYTEVLVCITYPETTDSEDMVLQGVFYLKNGTSNGIYMWGHIGGSVGGSRAVIHCDITHTLCTSEAYRMPTTYHAASNIQRRVYRWIEPEGAYIEAFWFQLYDSKTFPTGTIIKIYTANVEED